ncbi:MAG: MFS transporter [Bacteroidota bacterium]
MNTDQQEQKQAQSTVRTFAAASFLNDFGSDIIYPVWPFFVASLGANREVLGLLDGLGESIVSLSQALSGYLSDRVGKRKIFIWLGYLFGAISRFGYAISAGWLSLLPFRILDRAGKMRGSPRDAMVADVSTAENRGRNFGLLRSMDNLGAVLGILFCMAFLHLGYSTLFMIAAIPSVLAVILVLVAVKEHPAEEKKIFKGLSLKHLDRNFRMFLFLSAVFSLGAFSYSFLMLYAIDAGVPQVWTPLLYLVFTLAASLLSFSFGKLSDTMGRKKVLQIAFLLWGAVCALLFVERSVLTIVVAFVLYGIHRAALEPVQKAFVAELAPADLRASTLGGFQMVVGVCALPSSVLAGVLWDKVSPGLPLLVSLVLTIIATVLLMFVQQPQGVQS